MDLQVFEADYPCPQHDVPSLTFDAICVTLVPWPEQHHNLSEIFQTRRIFAKYSTVDCTETSLIVPPTTTYDTAFYAWTQKPARLLRTTINTQCRAVAKLLRDNPSLRSQLAEFIADAYPDGVDLAVAETPLDYDVFPKTCPWSEAQILEDCWPEAGQK